jgi:hypothetical protein
MVLGFNHSRLIPTVNMIGCTDHRPNAAAHVRSCPRADADDRTLNNVGLVISREVPRGPTDVRMHQVERDLTLTQRPVTFRLPRATVVPHVMTSPYISIDQTWPLRVRSQSDPASGQ